jgi:hypothetical protein
MNHTNSTIIGSNITSVSANTTHVENLNINTIPLLNNSLDNLLVRDTDGSIRIKSALSIIGATSADTFVNAVSYNNANKLTITRNDATSFDTFFNVFSGVTVTGNVHIGGDLTVAGSATTVNIISEDVLIADNFVTLNSNVTGGTPTEDAGIDISRGNEANARLLWNETTDEWEIGLSGNTSPIITESTFNNFDTYVTGNTNTVSATNNLNTYTTDLTYKEDPGTTYSLTLEDTFVTGGTHSNGTITFRYNDGSKSPFQVTGLDSTDTFSTGVTTNNGQIIITGNEGFNSFTGGTVIEFVTAEQGLTATTLNGDVTIGIQPNSVTNDMLVNDSITVTAGNGLSGNTTNVNLGGSIELLVNVDDSTIEIDSDSLRLKDDGIKEPKLHVTGTTAQDGYVLAYDAGSTGFRWIDVDAEDTFVTGTTFGGNQAILTRNDSVQVLKLSGGTAVTLRNPDTNTIVIDVDAASDNFYVTGGTLQSNSIEIGRTDTSPILTLSGGSNVTITNPLTDVFLIQSTEAGEANTASNVGVGQGIFSGKSGVDLQFYSLSGGSNVNLTLNNNTIVIDGTDLDTNDYVTGGTMVGNTLVLNRTDALSAVTVDLSQFLDNTDNYVTGGTYSNGFLYFSGNSSETTFNVDVNGLLDDTNTYVTGFTINSNQLTLTQNDGTSGFTVDLSPYLDNTDNFVTGGTMVGNTLVLNRTDALSAVTVDLSQFVDTFNDTFVTGVTVNGSTLSIGQNQGKTDETVDLSITRSFSVLAEQFALNTASRVTLTPLTLSAVRFAGVGNDDIAGVSITVPEDYSSNLEWYNVWRTSSTSTTQSGKTLYEIFTGDSTNIGSLVTSVETVNIIDSPESTANVFIHSTSVSPSSYVPKAGDNIHFRVYRDPGDAQDDFTGDIDLINIVFKYTAIR